MRPLFRRLCRRGRVYVAFDRGDIFPLWSAWISDAIYSDSEDKIQELPERNAAHRGDRPLYRLVERCALRSRDGAGLGRPDRRGANNRRL